MEEKEGAEERRRRMGKGKEERKERRKLGRREGREGGKERGRRRREAEEGEKLDHTS